MLDWLSDIFIYWTFLISLYEIIAKIGKIPVFFKL